MPSAAGPRLRFFNESEHWASKLHRREVGEEEKNSRNPWETFLNVTLKVLM